MHGPEPYATVAVRTYGELPMLRLRQASKEVRQFLDKLDGSKWTIVRPKKSKHIVLQYRPTGRKVFAPLTPSDGRSLRNLQSQIRKVENG